MGKCLSRGWVVFLICIGVVALAAFSYSGHPFNRNYYVKGNLSQEAYVWQRDFWQWNKSKLPEEFELVPAQINDLIILGAEIDIPLNGPKIHLIPIDFKSLKKLPTPFGIAIRVGRYFGPFQKDDLVTQSLLETVKSILKTSQEEGVNLKEIQIDFDCAESKLSGYKVWLQSIHDSAPQVPITFTALPSWLDSPSFKSLAKDFENFVLQVHSFKPPENLSSKMTLCDPAETLRWIDQAAGFNVPFRAALPTYGCWVAFDAKGKPFAMSTSQYSSLFSKVTNPTLRRITTDPIEMLKLVKKLQNSHPKALKGIIWYRFPVHSFSLWNDDLCWSHYIFEKIVSGEIPSPPLFAPEVWPYESGRNEFYLKNWGEMDGLIPEKLRISWKEAGFIGSEGLLYYKTEKEGPNSILLIRKNECASVQLRKYETTMMGWLSLNKKPKDIHIEIISP
jgi:hypothetical protein